VLYLTQISTCASSPREKLAAHARGYFERNRMKCLSKYHQLLIIVFISPFALCTVHISSQLAFAGSADNSVISTSYYDIDGDGKKEIIEIIQTEGNKVKDQELWCGMGEKWVGRFIVQVRNGKTVLDRLDLNKYINDKSLSFGAPKFLLIFKDYNNDGDIDFNLGQYSICDGNEYWLFTVRRIGKIEPLPFERQERSLFVQGESHNNSTDKIETEGGFVKSSSYDRDEEILYTDWYKWNGQNFVVAKHAEKSNKEPFKDYLIKTEQLVGTWLSDFNLEFCEFIFDKNGTFRADSVTGRWFVRNNRLTLISDKDCKGFTKGQEDVKVIVNFERDKFLVREKSGAFTSFKKMP
jgi:hypothetical protein